MENKYVPIDSKYYISAIFEDDSRNEDDFYGFDNPERVLAKIDALLSEGATFVTATLYARAEKGSRFSRPKDYYDLQRWAKMTTTLYALRNATTHLTVYSVEPFQNGKSLTTAEAIEVLLG